MTKVIRSRGSEMLKLFSSINAHVYDDDKKFNDKTSSSFGQRGATLINESGLYSLVLSSKLPTAKQFKRWVNRFYSMGAVFHCKTKGR